MCYRVSYILLAAIAFALPANATDLFQNTPSASTSYKDLVGPVLGSTDWGGFYVGVNGGYGWSDTEISESATGEYTFPIDPTFSQSSKFHSDNSGGFFGGQIGYNFQRQSVVFGIEADIQKSDIEGHADLTNDIAIVRSDVPVGLTVHSSSELDWFGTVRGRVGYLFTPNLLAYVTGGLAYGEVENTLSIQSQLAGNGLAFRQKDIQIGYVIGGGLEYRFNQSWSIKGEYQYMDFGDGGFSGSSEGSFWHPGDLNTGRGASRHDSILTYNSNFSSSYDNSYHTVRVGLNYHIN